MKYIRSAENKTNPRGQYTSDDWVLKQIGSFQGLVPYDPKDISSLNLEENSDRFFELIETQTVLNLQPEVSISALGTATQQNPEQDAKGDEDVPTFLFGGQIPAGSERQFYGQDESRIPTRATTGSTDQLHMLDWTIIRDCKPEGFLDNEGALLKCTGSHNSIKFKSINKN